MENSLGRHEGDHELNFKDTELRLGLPGIDEREKRCSTCVRSKKRCSLSEEESIANTHICNGCDASNDQEHLDNAPPAKVQVVGWPPIPSFRKNSLQQNNDTEGGGIMYVKVSMAGAPYLRKIHLKVYKSYPQLLKALQNMFKCTFGEYSEREGYNGSEYVPTYEDKDGDWMLVGDVPWDMFKSSCKRLRIMKGSEAKGLGCL